MPALDQCAERLSDRIDVAGLENSVSSEIPLNWNQTGPKGATGARGLTGTTGPTGVSGYQVVTATTPFDTTDYKTVTAVCPAGKQILGGGAGVFWQNGAPTPHPVSKTQP